ncbi:STAS domain-containing protein [Kitasatospora sp. NPDC051853]|uniref:STAS domain-containing protein n=1 Tax=Kitasatospora sp. NPDC051853 TaxID=3364058 RepID=UPI0037886B56
MEVVTRMADGVTCVELTGDLDARSAQGVFSGIVDVMPQGTPLLLDLSGVPFISSAGLRVLLMVHRRAQGAEVEVALAGLSSHLRNALRVTGFLRLFHIVESCSDGVAMLIRQRAAEETDQEWTK